MARRLKMSMNVPISVMVGLACKIPWLSMALVPCSWSEFILDDFVPSLYTCSWNIAECDIKPWKKIIRPLEYQVFRACNGFWGISGYIKSFFWYFSKFCFVVIPVICYIECLIFWQLVFWRTINNYSHRPWYFKAGVCQGFPHLYRQKSELQMYYMTFVYIHYTDIHCFLFDTSIVQLICMLFSV